MDSITHIVLGACIGEATAGRHLGKKAMLAGAVAQSIPDIDFVAHFWLDKTDDILAHRGITHSLLFGLLVTILISLLIRKTIFKKQLTTKEAFLLIGLNVFTHLFIDSFNAYGISWFEPFSSYRVSFHLLYVADPLFSVWPFIGFVLLLFFYRRIQLRNFAWRAALIASTVYGAYASINKLIVEKGFEKDLKRKDISYSGYFTTPTPFNSLLWFGVARNDSGYYIGYRSVFDRGPWQLNFYARNDSLLADIPDMDEVNDLKKFAQDYYTVQRSGDTTIFNVLRFGQVVGWYDPKEKFAFYYFLGRPELNDLVVQRGRFEKWNRQSFRVFMRRMFGN